MDVPARPQRKRKVTKRYAEALSSQQAGSSAAGDSRSQSPPPPVHDIIQPAPSNAPIVPNIPHIPNESSFLSASVFSANLMESNHQTSVGPAASSVSAQSDASLGHQVLIELRRFSAASNADIAQLNGRLDGQQQQLMALQAQHAETLRIVASQVSNMPGAAPPRSAPASTHPGSSSSLAAFSASPNLHQPPAAGPSSFLASVHQQEGPQVLAHDASSSAVNNGGFNPAPPAPGRVSMGSAPLLGPSALLAGSGAAGLGSTSHQLMASFPAPCGPPQLGPVAQPHGLEISMRPLPVWAGVSPDLMADIQMGRFVDFGLLSSQLLSNSSDSSIPHASSGRKRNDPVPLSFTAWNQVWGVFVAVLSQSCKDYGLPANLAQHQKTVHEIMLAGQDWSNYDISFRKAVESGGATWGLPHFQLYLTFMKSNASNRKESRFSGGGGKVARVAQPCYKFNKGSCGSGGSCQYAHKCQLCGAGHPVIHCHLNSGSGAVRPFQSGPQFGGNKTWHKDGGAGGRPQQGKSKFKRGFN